MCPWPWWNFCLIKSNIYLHQTSTEIFFPKFEAFFMRSLEKEKKEPFNSIQYLIKKDTRCPGNWPYYYILKWCTTGKVQKSWKEISFYLIPKISSDYLLFDFFVTARHDTVLFLSLFFLGYICLMIYFLVVQITYLK